ncbi:MAG TPA: DUF4089 domain-containing protein [Falsiroseomonas sp.]|jgi:hypothetical protein|nr:DUF4089 domain-containing protein [Falsiroseomonas sp.]
MSDPAPFDAEAYARTAAALVGLPLDPRHLPGVAANLRIAARMAAAFEGMPLGPMEEPAPVFVAAPGR